MTGKLKDRGGETDAKRDQIKREAQMHIQASIDEARHNQECMQLRQVASTT